MRVDPAGAAARGFALFARRYPSFLLLWLPILVLNVAVELALQAYGAGLGITPNVPLSQLDVSTGLRYLGVGVPLYLAFVAVELAFFAVIAAHVLDHVGESGATQTLRATLRMPGALLGLGVVLMLAFLGGIVLLVVGAVVFFHWYQFAPAALAQRRQGVVDALGASRRFAKERRTFGFTALVLFVAVGVAVLSALIAAVVAAGLAAIGASGDWVGIVVSALASWALVPLVAVLPASYWALAQNAPIAQSEVPSMPAERARTTKCPQCGTLVPYEATGTAVDVTCPSCGRQGKVL